MQRSRALSALEARIGRLEACDAKEERRLGAVARALANMGEREEKKPGEMSPEAAFVAALPPLPAIDFVACALAAAAAGGWAAPRVQLLVPGAIAAPSTAVAPNGKSKDKGGSAAGAAGGSVYIRDFLPPADLARVDALRASLPVDVPYEAPPLSHARSLHKRYYNDPPQGTAGAWVVSTFEAGLRAALGTLAAPPARRCTVLPRFRFIEYEEGQSMAPHTDGSRQHPVTLRRCTHTFLFYLSTCERGGETDLLQSVAADAPVLASVRPETNGLLLFAGKAAHVGRDVLRGQPKIVLRGDVYFDEL